MIYLFYALNFVLMIGVPILLARFISLRRNQRWGLFGLGAVTFVLSQLLHIPFNWLVLQRSEWISTDTTVHSNLVVLAIFAGLSAGAFEEIARYLTYRFWAQKARSWGNGLMLGAGHGGIESILIGIISAWGVFQLVLLDQGYWLDKIPLEILPVVQDQITTLFAAPWYLVLLGALERIFALTIHLSLSILVLQIFVRGQRFWLVLAILWHTLIDALAVYSIVMWDVYVTEALLGLTAVLSLGIIFALRTPEPVEIEPDSLPETGPAQSFALAITADSLERSRYSE